MEKFLDLGNPDSKIRYVAKSIISQMSDSKIRTRDPNILVSLRVGLQYYHGIIDIDTDRKWKTPGFNKIRI